MVTAEPARSPHAARPGGIIECHASRVTPIDSSDPFVTVRAPQGQTADRAAGAAKRGQENGKMHAEVGGGAAAATRRAGRTNARHGSLARMGHLATSGIWFQQNMSNLVTLEGQRKSARFDS